MSSHLEYVEKFHELVVYQRSRELSCEIFELAKGFPKEEMYSLTDQIRRASRSIGAQIAEAWAKRPYELHFISKLTDADAEQMETQHWLIVAHDCQYLSHDQTRELGQNAQEIGRMIGSMIGRADEFCHPNRGR